MAPYITLHGGSELPPPERRPRHYRQNNSLKKPGWPKKKGAAAYLRQRFTSICGEINQFGACARRRRRVNEPGLIAIRRRLSSSRVF